MLSMKGKKKFKSMNRRKIGFHSAALLQVEKYMRTEYYYLEGQF